MEDIMKLKDDKIYLRLKAHDLICLSLQVTYGASKEQASKDAMAHIRGKNKKQLKEIIEKYAV